MKHTSSAPHEGTNVVIVGFVTRSLFGRQTLLVGSRPAFQPWALHHRAARRRLQVHVRRPLPPSVSGAVPQ
jgi:hypothetical protein